VFGWVILTLGVLVLLAGAIWPFVIERRRPRVDATERHGAPGEFAALSQGVTHFRWFGPRRGRVAILIPGLTTPMIGLEAVAEGLGEMGYRVLTYDLYGRGLSDAPRGRQDKIFFLRQLVDLFNYHGIREEVAVAGYSMGGSIATAFAAEYPHHVNRVMLIASAGIAVNDGRFSRFCARVPVLGDWLHAAFAYRRYARAIPEKGKTREIDRIYRAQRKTLVRRGYLPAILSSRRGMLTRLQEQEHRKLGKQGIPVVAVWAGEDPVIPLRAVGMLGLWNREARQEVVNSADHDLPWTHSDQLNAALRVAMRN